MHGNARRLADLVRAADHGVDLAYLEGMGGHGYRVGTLAAPSDMRDHGVSPDFVAAFRTAGYELSPDQRAACQARRPPG